MSTTATEDREIVITRVIDAPRERVFRAWTDPAEIVRWWGPGGFTTTTREMDVSPGGVWRFVMHGPDGRDYPNRIVFDEVEPPERLTYTHAGEDDDEPVSFQTFVRFEAHEIGTKLTLRMRFPSAEARKRTIETYGAVEGGLETVARLAEHVAAAPGTGGHTLTVALPSGREIVMRRVFDAPRTLVFEAFSKPEHIRRWWGSRDFEMVRCEMDFRSGGTWRFVQRAPDGSEHPFKGEYREIVPPERIVQTFIYDVDGIREYPSLETATFTERDGRTVFTAHVLHASREARDGHLNAGMESGAAESFDRLAELVASMGGRR